MNRLENYLKQIVEPTIEDYRRNPSSLRHAFLACVVLFHSVDRAAYPKKAASLRQSWRSKSMEFWLIDMVANNFKHMKLDGEKGLEPDIIPLSSTLKLGVGEEDLDMHHIHFLIRDALSFVQQQVSELQ